MRPGGSRGGLCLRRTRRLGPGGSGRPFRPALLAGLRVLRRLRALRSTRIIPVSRGGGLCDPVSGLSKGLSGLRKDEGRQDGPDQQPAFRAHLYSRRSFQPAGIRPLTA
ncbi:hypothetical protein OCUBac02_47100 [Bosea sp. ANAM02]|nr:hypothetical protein OCUBac02_47100 [Bosea sp. ANAM02]